MNLQEIFNNGYRGVIRQGGYGYNKPTAGGGCAYLTITGKRCVISHSLDLKMLTPLFLMDNVSASEDSVMKGLGIDYENKCWFVSDPETVLTDMQEIHDNCAVAGNSLTEWARRMVDFASKHGLTLPSDVTLPKENTT